MSDPFLGTRGTRDWFMLGRPADRLGHVTLVSTVVHLVPEGQ